MNRLATIDDLPVVPAAKPATKHRHYPTYAPSGCPWLQAIPDTWTMQPLRRIGWFRAGAGFPDAEQGVRDAEIPFFKVATLGDNSSGVFIGEAEHTVTRETARRLGATVFPANSIVFAKVGAALLLNRRKLLSSPACLDNNMMAFVATKGDVRFIYYHLIDLDFGRLANPGAVPSLNAGDIRDIVIAWPSLDEQRAIAAFLDRKTARIDALIAKKQRLIELLSEKRTALIGHAVTKGLNPEARMKDSEIDWLGPVPEHWGLRKLGYITTMRGGGTPSKDNLDYWNGSIPWVSPKDMKRRIIDDSADHVTEEAVAETTIRLIDAPVVLIVVRGMILSHSFPVGLTSVPVTINQDMKAISVRPGTSADFLAYLLQGIAPAFLALVEESGHGTKCLRTDLWKGFELFLPPIAEQERICEHLQIATAKHDDLLGEIARASERLQEYRSALVSAAVTGKIDVGAEVAE